MWKFLEKFVNNSCYCSNSYCDAVKDMRCAGGNCTYHCKIYCSAVCIKIWALNKLQNIIDIKNENLEDDQLDDLIDDLIDDKLIELEEYDVDLENEI